MENSASSIPSLANDEWLSRLFARFKLTPLVVALILSVLILIRNLILVIVYDAWMPSAHSRGLAADPSSFVIDLLLQPAILAYFCWIQSASRDLLVNLANEGVLRSRDRLQATAEKTGERLRNPWFARISTLIALCFSIWLSLVFSMPSIRAPSDAWITTHPALPWFTLPVLFLVTYALIMFLLDLIIMMLTLNRLFSDQGIRVEPLNPDNAGGLGAIGRFSANLGYGIGIIGLVFSLIIIRTPDSLSTDYVVIMTLLIYLVVAPLVFFLPLRSAHYAMLAYRNHLVTEISMEYDSVFECLRASRSGDPKDKEIILKKLGQLDQTRSLIMHFPVWPFNTSSFRRFFGLTLSPLLPIVISLTTDWITGLLL